MANKFTNWWNRDKIRMQQLEDRITSIVAESKAAAQRALDEAAARKLAESNIVALEEHIADLTEQQIETESQAEAARVAADHSNSTEPWVEIKSDRIDPIKGLVIELDWNEAFVQYLKDNGITGRDPETAVQKWVAMLYQNLMGDLENIAIEKTDNNAAGEFE